MGVVAPEPIYGWIDYGGAEQAVVAVTAVEVGEAPMSVEVSRVVEAGGAMWASADEEGDADEVIVNMTSPAGGPLSQEPRGEG